MLQKYVNYEKMYYYIILSFAFVLPLSRAGISLFLVLLILIWILEGDFKRKISQIKENKILVSILLFLSVSTISLIFSQNIDQGLNTMRLNLYMLVVFVIATSLDKKYISTVITSFLLGMFMSEIIAYGVFFELWQFKHATPSNPTPFMIHIEYSVFLAFTALILLNRLVSQKYSNKEKLVIFLFFISVTGNLFITAGRTGQVSLIAGIIVLFIVHYRFTLKSLTASLLVLLTIYLTAYNISNTFNTRVNQAKSDINQVLNNNYLSSWGLRVAYWIVTYDIVKENPLGIGLGDYVDSVKENLQENERGFSNATVNFMSDNHPHNQFLLVTLQMGILGLLILINIIYRIIKQENNNKELKELSILFITVYFVSCLAEPLLIKQFSLTLFVLYVGLFAIKKENKDINAF